MNINILFVFLFIVLGSIFFFFKPANIQKQNIKEIALFEINNFTIYKLNTNKLQSIANGDKFTRYLDRYIIDNLNYIDNNKLYQLKINADKAYYKDKTIELFGNVVITKDDEYVFNSNEALYHEKTGIITIKDKFKFNQKNNEFSGTTLMYDNNLKTMKSKNIKSTFNFNQE